MLALSRLGVGIGEASVAARRHVPACRIAFQRSSAAWSTAAIAASIALGLGGALWIGGATADAWDQAWPRGGAPLGIKGWQAAFLVASLPGLVLAILLWRMEEPVRGAADGIVQRPDPAPFRAAWETLARILPGLNWLARCIATAPARAPGWPILAGWP